MESNKKDDVFGRLLYRFVLMGLPHSIGRYAISQFSFNGTTLLGRLRGQTIVQNVLICFDLIF